MATPQLSRPGRAKSLSSCMGCAGRDREIGLVKRFAARRQLSLRFAGGNNQDFLPDRIGVRRNQIAGPSIAAIAEAAEGRRSGQRSSPGTVTGLKNKNERAHGQARWWGLFGSDGFGSETGQPDGLAWFERSDSSLPVESSHVTSKCGPVVMEKSALSGISRARCRVDRVGRGFLWLALVGSFGFPESDDPNG